MASPATARSRWSARPSPATWCSRTRAPRLPAAASQSPVARRRYATPRLAATSSDPARSPAGRWDLRRGAGRSLTQSATITGNQADAGGGLYRAAGCRHDLAHHHRRQPARRRMRRSRYGSHGRPQHRRRRHLRVRRHARQPAPRGAREQRRADGHARAPGEQPGGQRRHELPADRPARRRARRARATSGRSSTSRRRRPPPARAPAAGGRQADQRRAQERDGEDQAAEAQAFPHADRRRADCRSARRSTRARAGSP